MVRAIATACALLMASAASAQATEPARGQPDILLLMPDQMRGDAFGAAGHPVVETPELDRLAAGGTLFRRAYTTCPSCIPARHALLTGQHPQTSGVVGFKARPIAAPTLPQLLADGGYTTALIGRHMHQFPANAAYGYGVIVSGSTYVAGDDYDQALLEAAPETGGIRELVKRTGLTFNHWQAAPWPLDEALHPTRWVAERARAFVGECDPDAPLFLTASFYAPHSPLFPPADLFEKYLQADLPAPAMGDWVDRDALSPEGDRSGHRVHLGGDTLRRAQAGYFGLIEHLDRCIAPLVAAFVARSERTGREWIIVWTTDHGELLGDHGFYRKCEPLEGSSNIPFVVAASPGLGFARGQLNHRPVCLEDLLPTFCALAGVAAPESIDGVDLGPALRGDAHEVRPILHFEHARCYSAAQAFHALTDGHHKYYWRPESGVERLFDLRADPREERDLSGSTAHADLLTAWRDRLIARLEDRPEGFSDGTALIPGRAYPPLIKAR